MSPLESVVEVLSVSMLKYFYIVISSPQEKEVHFRERMHALRTKVGGKLEEWEEKRKDFLAGFMGLFGRDGRIVSHQLN